MDKKEFSDLLKKCFGKEKDTRYHAIAMLIVYGFFLLLIIIMTRFGGTSSELENKNASNVSSDNNDIVEKEPEKEKVSEPTEVDDETEIENDVNYSYSYTITYDGKTEVYLGKKIDNKEKFTLVKNGETIEYAIVGDNYLILQNGSYHITDTLNSNFKYCDAGKILDIVENEISTESGNNIVYKVSNTMLVKYFNDNLSLDNKQNNIITLTMSDQSLKGISLDLSNYISSVTGEKHTLTINMEYADIGTTKNFDIKID